MPDEQFTPSKNAIYLGDGVYADFDGYHVILWTDNAGRIFLDDRVMKSLVGYARDKMREEL